MTINQHLLNKKGKFEPCKKSVQTHLHLCPLTFIYKDLSKHVYNLENGFKMFCTQQNLILHAGDQFADVAIEKTKHI